MNKVICYLGVIGSGKDYNSQQYIKENPKTKHINFADELREMAWDILGWHPETPEEYDAFKTCDLASFHYGHDDIKFFKINLTGREFLQHLGTEALRKRDPNFWVKCWVNKVQEALNDGYDVVCSDLRFENELRFALGINYAANLHHPAESTFIFCDYHSERYDCDNTHESEKLSQFLLSEGFIDGAMIAEEYFKAMFCNCMELT